MPSEKILEQKKQIVSDLAGKLSSSVAGVIVDYKGITVADDTKLRKELREAGVEYTVVKNTLLRFAAKEAGLEDPIAAAKILSKYAEGSKGKFSIKAGFMEGKVLDLEGVDRLAKLPSKEQLLVQLLSVLNGNLRGLAIALNAIVEKQEEQSA